MTDLLKRLDIAVPHVERWIDALHAEHLPTSIRASEVGFPRLLTCFPPALLRATRISSIDRIPFPPVSAYALPEFEAMTAIPMVGITFRDMYFVHPSCSEGVHFHELVHVVQWRTLGVRPFLLTYALGMLQFGYQNSPLEAMAYGLQFRFEAGETLLHVAEDVARHAIETREAAAIVFRQYGLELVAANTV